PEPRRIRGPGGCGSRSFASAECWIERRSQKSGVRSRNENRDGRQAVILTPDSSLSCCYTQSESGRFECRQADAIFLSSPSLSCCVPLRLAPSAVDVYPPPRRLTTRSPRA